jgi:hypothetical protein
LGADGGGDEVGGHAQIAAFPQEGLRAARDTAVDQWGPSEDQALLAEARRGLTGAALAAPASS